MLYDGFYMTNGHIIIGTSVVAVRLCLCRGSPFAATTFSEEIKSFIEDFHLKMHPSCITQHADFSNVRFCRAVLTVFLYGHRHHYGSADVPADENR